MLRIGRGQFLLCIFYDHIVYRFVWRKHFYHFAPFLLAHTLSQLWPLTHRDDDHTVRECRLSARCHSSCVLPPWLANCCIPTGNSEAQHNTHLHLHLLHRTQSHRGAVLNRLCEKGLCCQIMTILGSHLFWLIQFVWCEANT